MIGWPKDIMTLTRGKRSRGQGSYKMAVSKEYGVAAFQWKEPSVVNCVSSYLDFRTSEVEYVVESSRESVPCPAALVYYQEDMGRVDKVDHMRMADFRGFATVGHYQKWYKKALMGVLHLMLINGFHLWNSIAEKNPNMRVLEWYKYVRIVANKLMRFKGNA
jgi:Transposase IS4